MSVAVTPLEVEGKACNAAASTKLCKANQATALAAVLLVMLLFHVSFEVVRTSEACITS